MIQRMYCPKCKRFVKAYRSKGGFYCEECSERTITEFEKDNPNLVKCIESVKAIVLVCFVGWCAYSCHNMYLEEDKLDELVRKREELYCQTHKSQCAFYDKEVENWRSCQSLRNTMKAVGSSKESINNTAGSCYLPSHPSKDDEDFINAHPDLYPRDKYGALKR